MVRFLFSSLLASSLLLASCGGKDASEPTEIPADMVGKTTTMVFEKDTFNFGTLTKGDKKEFTLTFTNTGSEQLIIADAKGSCGCTVPEKPEGPIKPGEKGEIKVVFDSTNKKGGPITQTVTLTANTEPNVTVLHVVGQVIDPNADKEGGDHAGHDHAGGSHEGHNH
ncbi:MAG: DUF1573 domain-containing protein [Bacteroidetes bacterium]|nr:DUF1573 domain-containing protein [Bacteroidota bacterium]